MTLVKTNTTDGMRYAPQGRTMPTAETHGRIARKALKNLINQQNTIVALWYILLKHKMPLLITGNVILVLNWAFPEWFTLIRALIIR